MEISCHFMSQIDGSLVQIDIELLEDFLSFIHILFVFHTKTCQKDFGQVEIMEFQWHLLRKWWDFQRIWCHFWPNCRQKDMRKSLSQFLQGSDSNVSLFKRNTKWLLAQCSNVVTRDGNMTEEKNLHFHVHFVVYKNKKILYPLQLYGIVHTLCIVHIHR